MGYTWLAVCNSWLSRSSFALLGRRTCFVVWTGRGRGSWMISASYPVHSKTSGQQRVGVHEMETIVPDTSSAFAGEERHSRLVSPPSPPLYSLLLKGRSGEAYMSQARVG